VDPVDEAVPSVAGEVRHDFVVILVCVGEVVKVHGRRSRLGRPRVCHSRALWRFMFQSSLMYQIWSSESVFVRYVISLFASCRY